jgi:hypothetical protein
MKSTFFQFAITTLLLTTYVSCGGSMYGDDDDSSDSTPQQEQSQEGTFRGVAKEVNPDITSSNAAIQIKNQNDQFEINIFGSGPVTTHGQYIYSGTRCPGSEDDTNQDGVIDAVEGSAVYGTRVVPLDSDLTSDGGVFPIDAQYRYTQTASFSQMLNNLNIASLNLEGKVITIEGVPDATSLPATVQGAKKDFPIACGTLLKVEETNP